MRGAGGITYLIKHGRAATPVVTRTTMPTKKMASGGISSIAPTAQPWSSNSNSAWNSPWNNSQTLNTAPTSYSTLTKDGNTFNVSYNQNGDPISAVTADGKLAMNPQTGEVFTPGSLGGFASNIMDSPIPLAALAMTGGLSGIGSGAASSAAPALTGTDAAMADLAAGAPAFTGAEAAGIPALTGTDAAMADLAGSTPAVTGSAAATPTLAEMAKTAGNVLNNPLTKYVLGAGLLASPLAKTLGASSGGGSAATAAPQYRFVPGTPTTDDKGNTVYHSGTYERVDAQPDAQTPQAGQAQTPQQAPQPVQASGYAAGGGIGDLHAHNSYVGSHAHGGRMLRGPGDGLSDNIPAVIGKGQPARLADGEFVVSADVVSALGGGSTEAGARKLYAMMDRIRQSAHGTKKQIKPVKEHKVLPR